MNKTIFSIANSCVLEDDFANAIVLYDFLLKYYNSINEKPFDGYKFNLSLALKEVEDGEKYVQENTLEKLVLRALQALNEVGTEDSQHHIQQLLVEFGSALQQYFDIDASVLPDLLHSAQFFNKELYSKKNHIDMPYDALIDFYKKYGVVEPKVAKFSIDDMKAKLWGGFSNEVIDALISSLNSGKYNDKMKGQAALVLGRWYAVQNDWENSIKYTKFIKKFDESLFRRKRTKLLLIQSLINAGEFESAKSMVDFALNKELDGDYLCANSNLRFVEHGHASDAQRLQDLNKLFKSEKLLEVSVQPNTKYEFGCWAYPEHKNAWVEHEAKVSVLMPVYGAEEFIEVAINSMLSQTWRNLEIIAVEDRSPDKSWEKLQELAKKDSRLKIYRNDVNMGAYPTRNKALSLATGDFITVHDSDDWSHPQMIEMQVKALLQDENAKATCSFMTRVNPDLSFILRPSRENLEYIHRSYPSLLMRREDVLTLGQWDNTSANADDEFIQRVRIKWGNDALIDVLPHIPFSLFLVHENSLTQQKGTSLNSLTFGVRKTYADQAAYWRRTRGTLSADLLNISRTSLKQPFPIPQNLAPKNWEKNKDYDLVIISDLSLLGGTRRCNEAYIKNAAEIGLRVGLFHWPRFDLKIVPIADEYYELCYLDNVDLLVPEDEINAKAVIIHHPPILKYKIDDVPKIDTNKVFVLINQSPMQRWSQKPFYYNPQDVSQLSHELFGVEPVWIPISGRVREVLDLTGGYTHILDEIWSPPYSHDLDMETYELPKGFGSNRKIVIGRHARDHWTKWPQTAQALKDAYCADLAKFQVNLLGGQDTPLKMLGATPSNWNVLEFDSVGVNDFISELDFFLHFVNEDYIEEFGRNVMEAMALGRVVILPPEFKEIFADGAIYCEADKVAAVCEHYWNNPELYLEQLKKGKQFVLENCSKEVIQQRLTNILVG